VVADDSGGDAVVKRRKEISEVELLAQQLLPLIERARTEDRPVLDYLAGAVHALHRALQLEFKNRQKPLALTYWKSGGPRKHLSALATGQGRDSGPWLAGFYFNSALARIAAVRTRGSEARQPDNSESRAGGGRSEQAQA
jgi:hypothetical protein